VTRSACGSRCTSGASRRPAAVAPGTARQQRLAEDADLGVDRVVVQGFSAVHRPDDLDALVEDCAAVGLPEPA
jgi:hypothetical protein